MSLELLEACELLGPHRTEALALERGLGEISGLPWVRGALRRGERLRLEGHEQAPAVLAAAARQAMALGAPTLDLRCRLATVRALARQGRLQDARALAERAMRESAARADLALERALAAADARLPGAHQDLVLGLPDQVAPGTAHLHLEALEWLAEGHATEGRWELAERWYSRGEELAERYGDPARARELALLRGGALLRHGRAAQAEPALERALEAEDDRVRLAAALLLSGLRLSTGRAEAAEAAATVALQVASRRRNWHAYTAASIDHAQARALAGEDERPYVEAALAWCRRQGEPGALLQARLLELDQLASA